MTIELAELGANVESNPREVAVRAAHLYGLARAAGDSATSAVAATVLARARRNLGEIELAEQAIDDAIALAGSAGGDVLADAHMVAASIASFVRGAQRVAQHLTEAERHGSTAMRAKVTIQRGFIAKREGRLDEALALYEQVLPVLRASEDHVVTARVLSNRGSVNVLRGNPRQALIDFEEARELFEAANQDFAVVLVIENMAWAMVNLGNIPAALTLLDDACNRAVGHDHHLQDAAASKAEALMKAGLFIDAIEVLTRVVDALVAEGDRAGVAEALLLQAEASRLAGHPTSGALAGRAQVMFAELGAAGFEHQAQLEVLRSSVRHAAADLHALELAEQLAVRLAASGEARIEVEAWNLATMLALSIGQIERARSSASNCAARAASIPFVEHRLAAAHAVAAVEAAQGETERALHTVTDVLTEFERYRRAIGSPDARSGSVLHASALLTLGSDLAARTGHASRILTWSEHRRLSVPSWSAARVTFDSPETSRDRGGDEPVGREHATGSAIAELRSVLAELRQSETATASSGRDVADLQRRRIELEALLRDDLLITGGFGDDGGFAAEFDPGGMGGNIGVSFDLHGDRLLAVVVDRGEMRSVELGAFGDVVVAADAASTLLSACARTNTADRSTGTRWRRLQMAIDRLDRLVLGPLELDDGPVLLAMPAELHAAPWAATSTLRGRPVSLVPSLTWWLATSPKELRRSCRVTTVAGTRLNCAELEAKSVATCHRGATVLAGDSARIDAVIDAFQTSDIVHLAAHTRIRRDNPMWSTIELVDGPLVLHRLARHRMSPTLVVMSTCESALSAGACGAALPGFAAVLLEMGVQAVVASTSLLPDDETTCHAVEDLHRHVADGCGPAEALARVRVDFDDTLAALALTSWGRG